MAHTACFQDGETALQAALDLQVLQLNDVVCRERYPMTGQVRGAEEVGDLHAHVERDRARVEVFRDRVDQLLESSLGRNAEGHAGQAVQHRTLHAQFFDLAL